jgi:hypothetical protein
MFIIIWLLYSTEEIRHQIHTGAVLHLPGHPGLRMSFTCTIVRKAQRE